MGRMIKALCATAASIKTIRGKSSYNLEDYGMATATVHGAGLEPDAFEKQIASVNNVDDAKAKELMQAGNFLPSFMWNVNGWLASALNLTVISQEQKALAQTWPTDLYSKTLGRTIPAGQANRHECGRYDKNQRRHHNRDGMHRQGFRAGGI